MNEKVWDCLSQPNASRSLNKMKINKWSLDLEVVGNLENNGFSGRLGMRATDWRENGR